MLKVVDLCAGTGAFSKAFLETKKCEVVFSNDFEPNSKKIYDSNFIHKLILKDIHDIPTKDIPSHDILTGGFPCQGFSIAGKQLGFKDERSNVFWKIMDIIKFHKPRFVIIENVKNLVSHDDGNTFKIIKESIEKENYYIKHNVLNTSSITNVPQHRERIYIICFRNKEDFEKFNLNFEKVKKDNIEHYLENNIPDKYYYTNKLKVYDLLKENVTKKNTIYQYRRVYVRENKSNECPTLTANMGSGGHNVPIILDDKGIRKLTPRECFNLQGFDKNYILPTNMSDTALYKLSGNAVSVPVVKLIANKLIDLI